LMYLLLFLRTTAPYYVGRFKSLRQQALIGITAIGG
jgi:hypothetical protein